MSLFHEAEITLLGMTGGVPKMAQTQSGKWVANISICVETGGGNGRDPVKTWYDVSLWGNMAEQAQRMLTRPMMVYVKGEPRIERFKTAEGHERMGLKVSAYRFKPIGYTKDDARDGQQAAVNSQQRAPQHPSQALQQQSAQQPPQQTGNPQQHGGYQQPAPQQYAGNQQGGHPQQPQQQGGAGQHWQSNQQQSGYNANQQAGSYGGQPQAPQQQRGPQQSFQQSGQNAPQGAPALAGSFDGFDDAIPF